MSETVMFWLPAHSKYFLGNSNCNRGKKKNNKTTMKSSECKYSLVYSLKQKDTANSKKLAIK